MLRVDAGAAAAQGRRGAPGALGRRPRAAGEADPRLPARLQADPGLQRLPAVAGPRQRRAGHRGRSPRSAGGRSSAPTAPSARSTRSSSGPASTSSTCRSPSGSPTARAGRSPTTGTAARRRTAGPTVAGFPNLFLLLGPNTGLGHNSVVYMAEAQADYVLAALDHMRDGRLAALERDRRGPARAGTRRSQRRMEGTVWLEGGCSELVPGRATDATPRSGPISRFRFAPRAAAFRSGRVPRGRAAQPATSKRCSHYASGVRPAPRSA